MEKGVAIATPFFRWPGGFAASLPQRQRLKPLRQHPLRISNEVSHDLSRRPDSLDHADALPGKTGIHILRPACHVSRG